MTLIFDHGRAHAAHLPLLAERAHRGLDSGGRGGLAVPAQLARHADFRAGHSAVGRSRPSPSCNGWTSRSIRSPCSRLSLVAGVLVDDAIVEIENIVRHMRMGKSGYRAALDAADEIGLAVVATSFTIIAVFLPVSFMGGIVGQFFKPVRTHGRRGRVHLAAWWRGSSRRCSRPTRSRATRCRPSAGDGPIMTAYLRALRWCAAESLEDDPRGSRLRRHRRRCRVRLAHSIDVHAARGFRQRAAAPSSCLPAGRSRTRRASPPQRPRCCANHREVTDMVEFVGSSDGRDTRTAVIYVSLVPRERAQHEPEAMGAEHDAPAQPGARRAPQFFRRRRRHATCSCT